MSSLVLMENAGRGVADWIAAHARLPGAGSQETICILCGKGNNAGDGFVVARHLAAQGRSVRLVLLFSPAEFSPDAAANWRILEHTSIERVALDGERFSVDRLRCAMDASTIVVDAMLGTGAVGRPKTPLAEVIDVANQSTALRIALDLPSGLDADTGEPATPTFRSNATLTFVTEKIGFQAAAAKAYLGRVTTLPIGVPAELLDGVFRDATNESRYG